MAIYGFRTGTAPDMSSMYSEPYYGFGAGANISRYRNEEVDRLVVDLHQARDVVGRQKAFAELSAAIIDDMPYIGLYFKVSTVFLRNEIKGFEKPHVWNPYGSLRNWYIADYM